MQTPNTLNITVGTDVILNVTLEHDGVVLNPALIDNLQANLITGLGRKTPLETSTGNGYIVVNIPWVDGRLPGCYSLEITGSINDLAWSAVGKSIIRYTSATEIGRSTVDVSGDAYDVTMEVGYYFTDSPIEKVKVTVDDQVGEPYVETSYIRKELKIDFHNLKGNGIKSIEQTTTSTEDHGVNVVTITDDLDNATNVEIRNGGTGPQGIQGIPGESAVFDPTTGNIAVIKQETGNSITNPMSQKAITDELIITQKKLCEWQNLNAGVLQDCMMASTNNWYWNNTSGSENYHKQRHSVVEVTPGEMLLISCDINSNYGFLTSDYDTTPHTHGSPIPFSAETTGRIGYDSTWGEIAITVPQDAKYLCVNRVDSTSQASTWEIKRRDKSKSILDTKTGDSEVMGMTQKAITNELIEVEKKFGVFGDDIGGSLELKNCCLDANYGNKWRWRTSTASAYKQKHSIVPVQPGDVFMLKASGDVVNGQYAWLNEDYDPERVYVNDDPIPIVEGTAILWKAAGVEFYVAAPTGAVYLCLNRATYTALTNDWEVRKLESMADAVDDAKKVKELIANAKFVHRATEAYTKSLGLLHYTDIHGDDDAVAQIKKWMDKYGDYINDILNTGDMVKSNAMDASFSWEWWQESGLAEISLSMIGNHDGAYKTSQKSTSDYDEKNGNTNWFWNGEGKAWDHETYIAPYIEGWGITMPEGYDDPTSPNYKACYYHKDYTEQKIRLIALDCMHRFDGIVDPETGLRVEGSVGVKKENLTTEQEEWFVARLNETLDSTNAAFGYSVVVACHFPLDDYTKYNAKPWSERNGDYTDFNRNDDGGVVMDYKTGESSNWQYMQQFPPFDMASYFCLRNHTGFDRQGFPVKGEVNNFGNIIDAFINRNGKFVVWLSGHVHCDMLYYPDNYPNILVCANTMAGQGNGTDREDRQVNGVAANYVAIDTQNGLFKLVRLGLTTNKYLTPKNYICYDYINKKIVSEG